MCCGRYASSAALLDATSAAIDWQKLTTAGKKTFLILAISLEAFLFSHPCSSWTLCMQHVPYLKLWSIPGSKSRSRPLRAFPAQTTASAKTNRRGQGEIGRFQALLSPLAIWQTASPARRGETLPCCETLDAPC
ncbi:hypothetical protein V8C40DRAFT_245478 [Trichoderma camerunense]